MKERDFAALLTPVFAEFGLELEAVEVIPAGKRRLVRIVVDGDGPHGTGPLLDDIAVASKAASSALDAAEVAGSAAYTLEVSSRGVGRPLELPRHWRRNVGRLVSVRTTDEESVTGRILAADEQRVRLQVAEAERELAYAEVGRALVQVELNRSTPLDEATEEQD